MVRVPRPHPRRHRRPGQRIFGDETAAGADGDKVDEVDLLDWDPDGEDKVLAAICYPHTHLSEAQLLDTGATPLGRRAGRARCRRTSASASTVGTSPGARSSAPAYRFDVLGDYGAFRDLQRHRMLTIEWQELSPRHGYDVPDAVVDAGLTARFDEAIERSAALHDVLVEPFPEQAAYAVSLAYRIRYVMQMNAREAMHLCELRSSPQGHPTYRRVAQAMHVRSRRRPATTRSRPRCASSITRRTISSASPRSAPPKRVARCTLASSRAAAESRRVGVQSHARAIADRSDTSHAPTRRAINERAEKFLRIADQDRRASVQVTPYAQFGGP